MSNRIFDYLDSNRCRAERQIDELLPELNRIEDASEGLLNFWPVQIEELARKGAEYRLVWCLNRWDDDDEPGVIIGDNVAAAVAGCLPTLAERLVATCERLEGGCDHA